MTGVVVSANGVGGVTINIPIQFSVFAVGTRVITDGFTAPNIADAISIPEALCDVLMQTAGLQTAQGVTSMLGNVIPTDCQSFNAATGAWSTATGIDPLTALDTAQTALVGKMQGFVGECTSAANGTLVAGMNQLIGIAGAGDIAGIQAACSAAAFPNPLLGGVIQGAQELQKFTDIAKQMSSSQSELGSAMAAVKNITKNAMMLSAMGALAGGLASKCGLPTPPSIEDAFGTLSNGTCGNALNILNTGMSAVSAVANLPSYSGQLDDMNDVIWQGNSLGTTGINLPFAAAAGHASSIPAPAWVNPNKLSGTTAGTFPAGKTLGEAFEGAKEAVCANVETCKKQIEASLAPISDLGNAACGSANAFSLPTTALPNLNPGLEGLYQKANATWNEMSPAEQEAAQAAAAQRRADAIANAP